MMNTTDHTAPLPALTEAEALALAVEALKEIVDYKYRYTERYFKMLAGEKVAASIKADIERRSAYIAAADLLKQKVIQGGNQ